MLDDQTGKITLCSYPLLQVSFFHFLYRVVSGPCRKRHVSQRRVLRSGGSPADTIGHQHVFAGVQLVPQMSSRPFDSGRPGL
jgi:hypothetical protein